MWRKGWRSIMFVTAVTLAMLSTPAFAVEAVEPSPGYGPDMPLGMVQDWTELGPGEMRWHAFYFYQPHAMREGEEVEVPSVNVRMESSPREAGRFEILTQDEVDLWKEGKEYTAIGQGTLSCGCELADTPRKLNWTGTPVGHTLNYILVKNPSDEILFYRLFIDENMYVAFPDPIVTGEAPVAAVEPAPAVVAAPAAAPAAQVAVAPALGQWFNLQPGDVRWFNFAYDANTGILHDQDPASAFLTLFVEENHPLNRVFLDVFTDAEYQQLIRSGEDIMGEDEEKGTAVGCGTDNEEARGDLTWTGRFPTSQTLHVRIRLCPFSAEDLNVMLEALGKTLTPM